MRQDSAGEGSYIYRTLRGAESQSARSACTVRNLNKRPVDGRIRRLALADCDTFCIFAALAMELNRRIAESRSVPFSKWRVAGKAPCK